jgi:hypothetical protein
MTKRFLICALMTLLSAGVSAGFSLAGLLGPGRYDSFARYAASRSIALVLTILIGIGIRSRVAIAFLGIAMTGVQAFDGVIGAWPRSFEDLRTVCLCCSQRTRGGLAPARAGESSNRAVKS